MIKHYIEQRSEAWHQLRIGRFTASIFADVMASESTATYKDLITTIAGEIITGESEESYQNADMERGIELEPEARKMYESIFGEVEEIGFITPVENDILHEWVGISPDGLCLPGMIEIKCPKMKTHLNYIKAGVLPTVYKWQVQGQLMITGLEYCDFMSYYPNMRPFIIRVYPDIDMYNQLREKLIKSIELVKEYISNYNEYDYLK